MKIEMMNINFGLKKLQHITSSGIKNIKMDSVKLDSMPPILAYIEKYATENGFDVLNATTPGSNVSIFLIKK